MENRDLYLKNLIAKDEIKAQEAADYLINTADINLYKALTEKTEFLFDFVRNNISKRIEKAVNKENFINIIKLFDVYTVYYDDLFASILAKHANEDLTDKIFELLEKGSLPQKTYAAKYFSYIPDTIALEILGKYAFEDDEFLSYNSAEALGQMQDDISFDIALSLLDSPDDFEKLKAVKFFTAYRRNFPLKQVVNAMNNSGMPENIAGQIPYAISLLSLLNSSLNYDLLNIIDNIVTGLGEILELSDIFQFELFEIIEFLMKKNSSKNDFSPKIAVILLKSLLKFKLFSENQEYIYDEDKDTKYEIASVLKLLQSGGNEFWTLQKEFLTELLSSSKNDILSALPVIAELNIHNAFDGIKKLLNCDDEVIICEALNTIKSLNLINKVNIDEILSKIENPNIKAIIENMR